jgi:hypothetical protein
VSQPSLYKYLGVDGARLTLRSRTFKHAKPSDFNDVEDLTIQSVFPETLEEACKTMCDGFTDVILKNIGTPPTCANLEMRRKISLLQEVYRKNPSAAERVEAVTKGSLVSEVYDFDTLRKSNEAFIKEINELMQQNRVLCVSERIDSDRMWMRYADEHKGAALRILPNLKKDSKFKLFRKVEYEAKRPAFFDNAAGYQEQVLFGDHEKDHKRYIDRVVYTKTHDWEYEGEYRLCIPVIGEDWNVLLFHPEEIPELYLGAKMNDVVKQEIADLAKSINPKILILQSIRGPHGDISFCRH